MHRALHELADFMAAADVDMRGVGVTLNFPTMRDVAHFEQTLKSTREFAIEQMATNNAHFRLPGEAVIAGVRVKVTTDEVKR